jgi:phosphomannomutase/phosphoglucomutase
MRLDQWLFEQAYFDSREKAKREILAGRVRNDHSGEVLDKPGQKVPKSLRVRIETVERFVGRGGEKLSAFLKEAELDPSGRIVLDVGSSTGGFADCLLQNGAKKVICVDVGSHQLHEKIRENPAVEVFENQDIRSFSHPALSEVEWVTVDCSFISLRKIIPFLKENLPQAKWILLFKPQFEVGSGVAMPGGIVRLADRYRCLHEMLLFLDSIGLNPHMVRDSAVKGTKGNQESFLWVENGKSKATDLQMFRTYDIRGKAYTQLSPIRMKQVGKSLLKRVWAEFPKKKTLKLAVGRDTRPSSPELVAALLEGLSHPNVEVFYLGEISTPMLYLATKHYSLDAGFQVTASHNPKEDNGVKMMIAGQALFGEQIRGLGLEVLGSASDPVMGIDWSNFVSRQAEIETAYLKFVHSDIALKRKFRVAVDCGNGMTGGVAWRVLEKYCSDLEILFEEPDCSFPNHPADPTVAKNLKDLIQLMRKKTFDVGFAFDGDGDRIGVVTPKGRILWGDEILMILAEKLLQEKPQSVVIGEVKCSQKLFQMIRARGGQAIMYKTGHSLMKQKLKELSAPLAGEMSGHLFFGDRFFGFDDGLYAALRVLEVMDHLDLDLDEWIESFPEMITTPEIRMSCPEEEKETRIRKIQEYFSAQGKGDLNTIDGVRVSFPDASWLLARASNTEAVLVFRIEAPHQERLNELKQELETLIGEKLDV